MTQCSRDKCKLVPESYLATRAFTNLQPALRDNQVAVRPLTRMYGVLEDGQRRENGSRNPTKETLDETCASTTL
jgi:crotonobetainyl-CoA:carnitine CoA-transferase CaiB-like acyl-CoA transferase